MLVVVLRPPHEHRVDLVDSEELGFWAVVGLKSGFLGGKCSCRTQESPRLSRVLVVVLRPRESRCLTLTLTRQNNCGGQSDSFRRRKRRLIEDEDPNFGVQV